ncbi:hypothetical protein SAMN05444285_101250 [Draconibacterium orientale]|uniref:Uncharacterized protein n=1 Tax=Draconibacterium orientale TaxID=1168034 RepID=X5E401_9BACT|nr:hypothetical protein [Draconibacterium orientale]AHW62195.1 hypothetical protein FH5T_17110 [Draconibacterium orientale]SES70399.1 hypothetical protein SAMN05444285_101250 [Draconibacterium orientale]
MEKTSAKRHLPRRNTKNRRGMAHYQRETEKTTEEWKKPLRNGKNQREMQGNAVVLHSAPVNCISRW